MGRILKILVYLCLCGGVRCVFRIPSLLCEFSDQQSFLNKDGQPDVNVVHREVFLQFGRKGENPLNPKAVTFLITGSHLDLTQYMDNAKAGELKCELHRYNTNGSHVHWPAQDTQGYNHWFSCTVRHTHFTVTSVLRQASDQPAPGRHDYHSWPEIKDGDVLTVSVAMIMKTESPDAKARLGSPQKLHCQFSFDHKPANFRVEWKSNCEGVRTRLFSYNSLSGQKEGGGVFLSALAGGDASYNLGTTELCGQGTFVCSVSVRPVEASLEMSWTVEEQPQISLSVESVFSVKAGERQRVFCHAKGYYPREVEVSWYQYQPKYKGDATLPELFTKTQSGHKINPDGTHTKSVFFDFRPSVEDSGTQYTCSVSHQSLTVPLRKSFILYVEDPVRGTFAFSVCLSLFSLGGLVLLIHRMSSGKRRLFWRQPY